MLAKWHAWMIQRRFFILLVALLGLALIQPILVSMDLMGTKYLLNFFLTLILFPSIYAISQNKRLLIVTLCLGIPSFTARWLVEFMGASLFVLVTVQCVVALFLVVITWTILSYVLKQGAVTGEKISAAICVYMFIGLLWAFLFALTYTLDAGSFDLKDPQLSQFVYYSFITLSTLGYGDITPLSPVAQALAYVEAITGQIYLTVLVARLVGLHIARAEGK